MPGYPSRSFKTGGLQNDHFVKPSKSHAKLYGFHTIQDRSAGSLSFWHCDSAKLNSAYSQIARSFGLTTPALTSCLLSQDTLRRWEKAAMESIYVCNQAAGLSRCLSKVQQGMQSQLKELQSLMNFNASFTLCMAKAMEHLSDFVVSMTNVTLVRRDSHLAHVKSGLKLDTLAALCQAHWIYLHCSQTLC